MATFNRRRTSVLRFVFFVYLVCLLPPCSLSQDLNPVLTATESTVTLEWSVEGNATSYQVTWHRSIGFFFFDAFYYTPFDDALGGRLNYSTGNLLPGVSYTFLLFRDGNSTEDKIFHRDIVTVPLPPENLEVLNRTSSSVLLTWEHGYNSSQDHYMVEYQLGGSLQTVVANSSDDPLTFNLTDLMPGHSYLLSMRAVSHDKHSNSSAPVTAVTAPGRPEDLTVEAVSTDTLRAVWEPGNNSLQDSFEVWYSIDGETTQTNTTCTASPCEFVVVGEPGQLYLVYVYAVQQSFRSEAATVRHNTAPAAPRNLSGFGEVRALQLSWEIPLKGVFESFRVSLTNAFKNTETSYAVGRQGDDSVYMYSVTDLAGGVNYLVRVFSVTSTEESKDSVTQLYHTLPEPVSSLSGQALNTTAIQLSWQNPVDSEYTGVEVNLTDSSGTTSSFSLTAGHTNLTVGDLHPGAEYAVVVVVMSKVQVDSSPVNASVRTKPEIPQLVTVESGEESLGVTLSGGADPNGIYDTIRAVLQEDGTLLTADSEGKVEFQTLTPGTLYTLEAFALSGNQTSESLLQPLFTKPRPPQNLTVEVITSEELNITWVAPDRGSADNYTVTVIASHGAEVPVVQVVSESYFPFTGAHPGETYNVTVVANKGTEFSVAVMEQNTTYPESVAALQKVNATSDSITVNWTAPVSGRFRMFQLGINPQDSPNSVLFVNASSMDHTFDQLRAGRNYTVAIRTVVARNVFGVPVRLRAVTKPLPVEGLRVETLGADSLNVSWAVSNNSRQDRFTILQDKDGVRKSQQVSAVDGQTQYSTVLDQLLSGHTYTITLTAVREIDTDIEESLPEVETGTTDPLPVLNLTVTASDQTVQVSWQPAVGSRQTSYRIRYRPILRDPDATWLEQTAVAVSAQFSPVFPGEKYEVQVFAVNNGQESLPSTGFVVVAPLAPEVSVDTTATTTDSITLQWTYDPSATFVELWRYSFGDSNSFEVAVTPDGNTYMEVLSPLTAGETYTVEVMAVSQGVMSAKATLTATAKPLINTRITETRGETTSSQLTFDYTVTPEDVFDTFRFILVGVDALTPVLKGKGDTDRRVTFTGLQGGQLYTVQAVTVSSSVDSDPITQKILTAPNNVKVAFQNKSEEIVVGFTGLEGGATRFVVECRTPSNASCGVKGAASNANSTTMDNLVPFTTYTIVVTTVAEGRGVANKTATASYSVRTAEAAPSAVRQFVAREEDLRTVQLSWEQPLALNGWLRSYRLEYTGTHSNGDVDSGEQTHILNTTTTQKLTTLKAGYTYTFKVQALTVALGPASEKTITLQTAAPQFRAGNTAQNSRPVKREGGVVTEDRLTVQLTNAFTDDNGPILGYTVIVSTDSSANTSPSVLPSWRDAQRDGSVSAYQATSNCSDLFLLNSLCGKSSRRAIRAVNGQDSVVFELGTQSADECQSVQYCNGPLKAGTEYYVKLRAFTLAGFTDTEYSSKIRTADAPKNSSVAIIAAVVSVVVLLVVIIIVVIVVRRRRRPKRATKYHGTDGAGHHHHPWEQNSLKNFSRPVKLQDFPEHVQKMSADSDFKFAEEYEDLKEVGRDQTCHAAELPVNRPKNRFTNILPYDHSRVKLLPTDDEEGSDYINANYMPGYSSKREYIATQGPLPATRDDFWRMAWEQNARNIVMLTRCMEKGREKSDHYWPADSDPKYYGDLQVVILNETHLPDWTITEFRMCLGDNCRQVRHFHYKAWPDFGVPKNHSSLIRFVRMVRDKLIKEGGPILTHCSAGVGRSGTFIVLDHCLRLIREKDEVDIFSIVYSLRRERVLMVQTEQQYKFIHECLSCVLEGREDDNTYANVGQVNVGFEGRPCFIKLASLPLLEDDEGINVEVPS
ncbi:tyrosine-protein phosphatase 10D-like isoform X2 [Babylonia areolata]|uniref:tyrosine-protein phosphatase 10D-like isoform X2 n=1 Tax=Babylonia areolata TaxID=304850 RepID=UPI003FCFF467